MFVSNARDRFGCSLLLAGWVALAPFLQAQGPGEMPISTPSKEALALFVKGRDLAENAENVPARPILDQALAKDPGFAMAHAYRAMTGGGFQVRREHLQKALALADKATPGERAWILMLQASVDGVPAEEGRQVEELLRLFPGDKRVHVVAAAYYGGGPADLPKAYRHLRKATALDPTHGAAFNQLGYTCFRMGKFDEAEEAFKRYISLRPGKPNPHDSYAEFLLDRGRYDDSIAQYRQALEAQPSFVSAHAGMGHNLIFKGEYAQAREAYERMADTASEPADRLAGRYWQAVSYVYEGRIPEALAAFDVHRRLALAEEQYPSEVNSLWSKAFIQLETGNLAACARGLEATTRCLETSGMSPTLKGVWNNYLKVGMAQVYSGAHAFECAKALLKEVAATAELIQDAELRRAVEGGLGILALEEHQPEAALAHFEKADREDPYLWFEQALAWEEKGDAAKAAGLKRKVATCNLNSLGLSLVRGRAAKGAGLMR